MDSLNSERIQSRHRGFRSLRRPEYYRLLSHRTALAEDLRRGPPSSAFRRQRNRGNARTSLSLTSTSPRTR
jgi:hypothetical protein